MRQLVFKLPYSVEPLTPDNYIAFLERCPPFAMTSAHLPGAMAAAGGRSWRAAGGVLACNAVSVTHR